MKIHTESNTWNHSECDFEKQIPRKQNHISRIDLQKSCSSYASVQKWHLKSTIKSNRFTNNLIKRMNNIKIYQELTYIETYDRNVYTITNSIEKISKLLNEQQFINLWDELINRSNIKRVFKKELSDVDKVVYSIEDKTIRNKVLSDIDKRIKDWLRVNVEIVQNLLSKYQ